MEIEDVDFEHTQRIAERRVEEAIKAIFAQIKPQDVNLDGIPAKIKVFYPPKLDPKERPESDNTYGKWSFGIDVTGDDWHLEFIMYQAGWGGSPMPVMKVMETEKC